MRFALAIAGLALVVCAQGKRAPVRSYQTKLDVDAGMAALSNWGRWGKDDQLGTFNLITPEKRKAALKLVREGVSVSMAHTLDKQQFPDNPRPIGQQMTLDAGGHAMDLYTIWYHGSTITHIDALCHYSYDGKIYNGYSKADKIGENGCGVNGVENQRAGVITRGVLVDIPRLRNVEYLEPGVAIGAADVEAWEKFANVKIGPGDAVFLRTGRWTRRAKVGPWNVAASAAGWHASAMPLLKERDIALLGNDGVQDVQPSGIEGVPRPIHQLAIVAMGLPLIDVMDLEAVAQECAKRKRWDFLVTLSAPPMPGGTGFPVNPIATF